GMVQQCQGAWGPSVDVARVVGTKGSVWTEGSDVKLADKDGVRTIPLADDLRLPPVPALSNDPRLATSKWKFLIGVELPPYVRLCEAFFAQVEGREPSRAVKLPTFADGVACMEVLDAIRTCAATGG